MENDTLTMQEQAYINAWMDGTLVITEHKSPKNSGADMYYNIWDSEGIIEMSHDLDALLDNLKEVEEYCGIHYEFFATIESQVNFELLE